MTPSAAAMVVPPLQHVASPSPSKAKAKRLLTEKPALAGAALSHERLVLPTELFKLATSRSSQADVALVKALDDIQLAVRLAEGAGRVMALKGRGDGRAGARSVCGGGGPEVCVAWARAGMDRLYGSRAAWEPMSPCGWG